MSQVLSRKLLLLADEPAFWCPGCGALHRVPSNLRTEAPGPKWQWNEDAERPTFSPSILVRTIRPNLKLVRGRALAPGKRELVVGEGVVSQFRGVDVGKAKVVTYKANGSTATAALMVTVWALAAGTSGRSRTEQYTPLPAGLSNRRPSRPRPALWCAVSTSVPWGAPSSARSFAVRLELSSVS